MTVSVELYRATDPRLGRHVQHDPRSINFAHPVWPSKAIQTMAWTPAIGILDQGQIGSCVANSGTELLATADADGAGVDHVTIAAANAAAAASKIGYSAFPTSGGDFALNEDFAVRLYEVCTRTDDVQGAYPAQDTGSTGLGLAKALVLLGLAKTAYTHAFSIAALQTALQTGPAPIGVAWYQSQFTPAADGRVPVNVKSGLAGGHEILICKYDKEQGQYWFPNHWGNWGVAAPAGCGSDGFGWGYFNEADMATLMSSAQQGDVTVISPLRGSTPQPPQPQPGDADATLWAATKVWAGERHTGANRTAALAVQAWGKAKNFS